MMALAEQPYTCEYCGTKFMKEKTLFVHVCEQKRRALAKTEKHVVLAYDAFVRFFNSVQKSKAAKTYEDFCKSPYYNAFVKFGSFVSNVNPLYPDQFIDYVIRSGVKLDHWCREELYDTYVLDLIKREPVEVAVQRSVTHMMDWGDNHNAQWNHYFLYVSLNRAVFDIKDGKISPWILLNSTNGKEMLQKFNDEQLESIWPMIDTEYWRKRFKQLPADVEVAKQVIKELNI